MRMGQGAIAGTGQENPKKGWASHREGNPRYCTHGSSDVPRSSSVAWAGAAVHLHSSRLVLHALYVIGKSRFT